jgi:hypothetical protein
VNYCLFYLAIHIGDKGWSDNGRALIEAAATGGAVPMSLVEVGRPAAFWDSGRFGVFLTRYDIVVIYGVVGRSEQEELTKRLLISRTLEKTPRPIRVYFYERENWTTWKNEATRASGGHRGPERLLRVAVLN